MRTDNFEERRAQESKDHVKSVVLAKLRSTVDKFAYNPRGKDVIVYTTFNEPDIQKVFTYEQQLELFTDLHGDPAERWELSKQAATKRAERNRKKRSKRQLRYRGEA